MKPEGSLPYSQQPTAGTNHEPDETSPHLDTPFFSVLLLLIILLSLLCLGFPSILFPSHVSNSLYAFLYSSTAYLYLSHSPSNNIHWAVQTTKLHIISSSPLLRITASLSTLFSGSLGLYSSPKVRDQVQNPPKTRGKFMIVIFALLTFSNCRRDNKIFWTEGNFYEFLEAWK